MDQLILNLVCLCHRLTYTTCHHGQLSRKETLTLIANAVAMAPCVVEK